MSNQAYIPVPGKFKPWLSMAWFLFVLVVAAAVVVVYAYGGLRGGQSPNWMVLIASAGQCIAMLMVVGAFTAMNEIHESVVALHSQK